ncbi:MAG: hypothetical protein KDJ74_06740 [Notoacmeibacter sp.]|nr:hypothetical protein [Notoacmeibacter sp.]
MDNYLNKEHVDVIHSLHDRVLIRRIEVDETTRGGTIIPDTAKEKPQEGEVVSVGAGDGARTASAPRWT